MVKEDRTSTFDSTVRSVQNNKGYPVEHTKTMVGLLPVPLTPT
jgi:hypothetical protein